MDIADIMIAGIGGGLGAALGYLIAGLIPRKEGSTGLGLRGVVAIVLAVVGMRVMPPVIDPYIGPALRGSLGSDVGGDIDALFAENPLMVAMSEVDPEAHANMRIRVVEAYEAGGMSAARDAAIQEGMVLGQQAVLTYAPRADDDTVIGFQRAVLGTARGMMSEPRLCYAMMYSSVAPQNVDPEDIARAGGHPASAGMQDAMVALIRAAGSEVVAYDADFAAAGMGELQMHVLQNYSDEQIRYFSGYAPRNDGEYAQACGTMIDLLQYQLNHDYAIDMIRAGFSG